LVLKKTHAATTTSVFLLGTLDWSPEQISGWLKTRYSDDERLRVSHETIYRSLFIQARGVLNDVPQLAVEGQQTPLRSQGRVPGMLIRIMGAIGRTATMARNLPAHRGGRSIQSSGNLTKPWLFRLKPPRAIVEYFLLGQKAAPDERQLGYSRPTVMVDSVCHAPRI
jgi:hypothetical protein